jgi:NADH-quinone oxidoreductase subunit C
VSDDVKRPDDEAAEHEVAEAIEAAIDQPTSIEEEMLEEAAAIEEIISEKGTARAPEAVEQTLHPAPDDPVLATLAAAHPGVRWEQVSPALAPSQDEAIVAPDDLLDFVAAAREAGYSTFIDLCGVDYLRRRPRFEVVTHLLDPQRPHRLRIRTGAEAADPSVPSITSIFPGANFYEREAFDLYGIVFEGHPDLSRILLPDDWEGHPLRKDYAVGSVPVQFKGSHKAT